MQIPIYVLIALNIVFAYTAQQIILMTYILESKNTSFPPTAPPPAIPFVNSSINNTYSYEELESSPTQRLCYQNPQCSAVNHNCCPDDYGIYSFCCFPSEAHGSLCSDTCTNQCVLQTFARCACSAGKIAIIENDLQSGRCIHDSMPDDVTCQDTRSQMSTTENNIYCGSPILNSPPPLQLSSQEFFFQVEIFIPLIIGGCIIALILLYVFFNCTTERANAIATVLKSIRGNNEIIIVDKDFKNTNSKNLSYNSEN